MKLNLGKVLDLSKVLSSKVGQELQDVLQFVSDFSEQTLRALRNGLTFADNFRASEKVLSVKHGVESIVYVTGTPTGCFVVKSGVSVDSFFWRINEAGQLVIKVGFDPVPTDSVELKIIILL